MSRYEARSREVSGRLPSRLWRAGKHFDIGRGLKLRTNKIARLQNLSGRLTIEGWCGGGPNQVDSVPRSAHCLREANSSPGPFGLRGSCFQLARSKSPQIRAATLAPHMSNCNGQVKGPFRCMLCCIRQSLVFILTDCLTTIGRAIFGETWKPRRRSDGTICNGIFGIFGRIITFCTVEHERHERSATMVDAHWYCSKECG